MKNEEMLDEFVINLLNSPSLSEGIEKEMAKNYPFSKKLRKAYLSFRSGADAGAAFSDLIKEQGKTGELFAIIATALEKGNDITGALIKFSEALNAKKEFDIEYDKKTYLMRFTIFISDGVIFPILIAGSIFSFSKIFPSGGFDHMLFCIGAAYVLISSAIDSFMIHSRNLFFLSAFSIASSFILLRWIL